MIEEDQNQICSNNSSGGDIGNGSISRSTSSSSKKLKQKKMPQRGLGVAQLEKIRMEEQQMNDGNNNISTSSSILSTISSSQNTISLPNYSSISDQKSSKFRVPYSPPPPPPPPTPMSVSHQNPVFRACNSLPDVENFQIGWPSNQVHLNFNFPRVWHPNIHDSANDWNILPLPDVLPISGSSSTQNQPLLPNSLVNVSSNLSSSSVLNFPMEPPSNQRIYSNYPPLLWPDDEKMIVGMKRPCPFTLDNLPLPTFSKLVPVTTHPLNRSDEPTTATADKGSIPIFRDIPSYSSAKFEPQNSRKISKTENGNSHSQELLSLAPPLVTSSFPNSRSKQSCKLGGLPYQVSIEDTIVDSRQGDSTSNMLSFFPPKNLQVTTSAPTLSLSSHNRCNSEVGESIDLNLRL